MIIEEILQFHSQYFYQIVSKKLKFFSTR